MPPPGTRHATSRTRRWVLAAGIAAAVSLTAPGHASPAVAAHGGVDFNGDGYADLAIGAPSRATAPSGVRAAAGGAGAEGAVVVLYGSPSGLSTRAAQLWTENTAGVPGVAGPGDRFGLSLAAGDFNGDGYADLAVGEPGHGPGGVAGSGAVVILYGSPAGLTSSGARLFDQATPGVAGVPRPGERFGYALAAGDLNGDGRADLAVGAPTDMIGGRQAGSVTVLYGSAAGLSARHSRLWSQATRGIAGRADTDDLFGNAVALGDLNGDGCPDLVVGVPGDPVRGLESAGTVLVMQGSRRGPTAGGSRLVTQSSLDLLQPSRAFDRFGQRVATGDLNGDGYADLAVGAPTEDVGGAIAGAVAVVDGSRRGLARARLLTEDSPGVMGRAEDPDQFGFGLAAADVNGDGRSELVVGAPDDRVGHVLQAGAVTVVQGSAAGAAFRGRLWSQNSPSVPGVSETGDQFGLATAFGDFNGDGYPDLAVGAGEDMVGGVPAGAVDVLPGSRAGLRSLGSRLWDERLVPAAGRARADDGFGLALAAAG